MKLALLSTIAFAIALIPTVSVASIQTFNSEPDFFAAAPAISTETFDSYPFNHIWSSPSMTFDGVHYKTDSYVPDEAAWTTIDFMELYSYPNALVAVQGGDHQITFGNGNHVKAFGFWFGCIEVEFQIHDVLTITEINGNKATFDLTPHSDSTIYLGYISDSGISTIDIIDWPDDGYEANWSYDNVSHSQILPEPSSILALLCGIGSLGVLIRRKSK